jgi:hypothetical protein
MTTKDSPLSKPEDLKGKRIGQGGEGPWFFAARVLGSLGMDIKRDVEWKVYPWAELKQALEKKEVDANKHTTKAHARQTARESAHCGFPSTVDVNSFLLEATTALSRRAFKLIINDLPMSRIGKTTVVRMGTRVYNKLRAVSKKMGYGVPVLCTMCVEDCLKSIQG